MRAIAETTADLDLQISLLSEHEITRLLQLVSHIAEKLDIGEGGAPDSAELKREVAPKGWSTKSKKKKRAPGPAEEELRSLLNALRFCLGVSFHCQPRRVNVQMPARAAAFRNR
jgi:hypothetical protein